MTLRLFLDPITLEKIMKAVKSGKYDDEYAFIFEAIHEKLNQGDSKQSEVETHSVHQWQVVSDADGDVTSKCTIQDCQAKLWSHPGQYPPEGDVYFGNHLPVKLFTDQVPDGISVQSLSDNTFKTLKSLMVDNSNQTNVPEFSQDEIYGPGSAGLIWIFHNRFFPVKIVLNIVAQLMVRENKTWIKLDEFSDEIIEIIEKFVSEIHGTTSLDSSVHQGFPLPEKALFERYKKMRKERSKAFKSNIRGFKGTVDDKIKQLATSRLTSSRLRYSSQFIGKSLQKDHGLVYSGACFEMGLLAARWAKKKLEITLTPNGLDFTKLKNPVIAFVDGEEPTNKDTFSKEERDFIRKKIVERYELENKIVTNILEMQKTIPNKEDQTEITKKIRKIFEDEKTHYLKQKFPDIMATKKTHSISDVDVIQWRVEQILKEKGMINSTGQKRDSLWAQLSSEIEQKGISQKDVLEYLVDNNIQFQINGTMSRMKELRGTGQ